MTTSTTAPGLSGMLINGTDNADIITDTALDDRMYGLGDQDHLRGSGGDDQLYGGEGDDTIEDSDGSNLFDGGNGDDRIIGGGGSNTLHGGAGDDYLAAWGEGAVALNGGDGNDYISLLAGRYPARHTADGGAGDDTFVILSDWNTDTANIRGGSGSDTYTIAFSGRAGALIVSDFTAGPGGDKLDIWLGQNWTAGNPFGVSAKLRFDQRGADVALSQLVQTYEGPRYFELLTFSNIKLGQLTVDNIAGGHTPIQPRGTPGLTLKGSNSLN